MICRTGITTNGQKRSLATGVIIALFLFLCMAGAGSVSAENGLVKFYQDHISQVDGDRCPMAPSCSSYARQAIAKHGIVVGWVMACDRLVRCGRCEARLSPEIMIKGQSYVYDPVSANDFWWFEKETEALP